MEDMPTPSAEVTENISVAPTVEEVKARIVEEVNALIVWVLSCQSFTFFAFETQLVPKVLVLGCLFIQLFLCFREEQFQATHPQPEPGYRQQGPKDRLLGTFFGKVRYWRTYFYRNSAGYYRIKAVKSTHFLTLRITGLPVPGHSGHGQWLG